MTPTAKDTAARMLADVVKLPIGERAAVLAMVIRVLSTRDSSVVSTPDRASSGGVASVKLQDGREVLIRREQLEVVT